MSIGKHGESPDDETSELYPQPTPGMSSDEKIIGYLRFCAHFIGHHTEGRGSQRRVLMFLSERGAMTQHDILVEMGVRPASLSELLGKLEARGCVVKERSESDKRNYSVSITDEGRRTLEEMQEQYNASMSDLLSGLDTADRDELARLLGKLRELWLPRVPDRAMRRDGHKHPYCGD